MGDGTMTTEHTVWCARCNEWEQQPTASKSRMARMVKSSGWRYVKPEGWLCPQCSGVGKTKPPLPDGWVDTTLQDIAAAKALAKIPTLNK